MELVKSPLEKYRLMDIVCLSKMLNCNEVQRVAMKDRVDILFASYFQRFHEKKEIIIPGCLTVTDFENNFNLIDGQHRFLALMELFNRSKYNQQVCVNFIKVNSKDEIKILFNIVNNTIPVAEMPTSVDRTDTNTIVKYFTDKYSTIFKTSKTGRVHRPHINQTVFEEEIGELLTIYPQGLLEKLIQLNKSLESRHIIGFKLTNRDTEQSLTELRNTAYSKGGLYFGMFSHLECFDELKNNGFRRTRKSINPVLRRVIFKMFFGDEETGNCLFCKEEITIRSCHMAHNIAFCKDGEERKDNLFPCCGGCNLASGRQNFEEVYSILK